jgi:hypothetical protein
MLGDALLVLQTVAQALEDLGIPYLIGGSLASSIYGTPRLTQDVDFVADLREEQVEPLVAALQTEFYIDDLAVRRAIRIQRSFNVIHLATMYKADVFVLKAEPYAQEQMRRRREELLKFAGGEAPIWFCTAEDVVLQKLRWFRKGGGLSAQQWNDLLSVLKVQAERLDYAYLRHWAAELGLDELLTQALADAGISV